MYIFTHISDISIFSTRKLTTYHTTEYKQAILNTRYDRKVCESLEFKSMDVIRARMARILTMDNMLPQTFGQHSLNTYEI